MKVWKQKSPDRGSGARQMKEIILKVKGIRCEGCEKALKDAFSPVAGVISVEPSRLTGEIKITYDEAKVNSDLIEKTIRKTGREVIK